MTIQEEQLHGPRHKFCSHPGTDDPISFVDADSVLEETPLENPDVCAPNIRLRTKMALTNIRRCCSPMLDATHRRSWNKAVLWPTKQTDRGSTCNFRRHHEQNAVAKKAELMAGSAAIALMKAQRFVQLKASAYKLQHRDAGFQSHLPNLSARATRLETILASRSCMQLVDSLDFREDDYAKLSDVAARDCAEFQRGTPVRTVIDLMHPEIDLARKSPSPTHNPLHICSDHVSKNKSCDSIDASVSRILYAIQTSATKSNASVHVLAAQFSNEHKPSTDGPTKDGEPCYQMATARNSRDSAACSRTARFRRKALEKRIQTNLAISMSEGTLASLTPSIATSL